jgi:hypothetical protein
MGKNTFNTMVRRVDGSPRINDGWAFMHILDGYFDS